MPYAPGLPFFEKHPPPKKKNTQPLASLKPERMAASHRSEPRCNLNQSTAGNHDSLRFDG